MTLFCSAVKDCAYVMHVASPFPNNNPKDEKEVIDPAVEGTKNVLKACVESKTVKRIVLTSSIAAISGKYVPASLLPTNDELNLSDSKLIPSKTT